MRGSGVQTSKPAVLVRAPAGREELFKRRFRVACAELGCSYAEFIEDALDRHDEAKAAMRHPLDRRAVAT
ncbi:DNA binding protein [Gordonia phage Sour]|uniref:Ribbon-helix-helix DNA binding domain protein n=1 Tax=Gordonia phage Sour TaxID=2182349 RepID=A0A2U8UKV5_9CAUD|nr:DNA binding protein [Gordonia phage Sour]AWN04263.1 ribbon-helix-helix DNA binding domain protein [Gordonia phage Sour]